MGPQLGSVLSKCSRLASMPDAVPILQDLWAVPKLPLTIRKHIIRALVGTPGPEVSPCASAVQLLDSTYALHHSCHLRYGYPIVDHPF